ncbi:MAG: hypothetical protein KAW93_07745 [Methanogenium sp.]|nr:hypothetical protein [Methanogenium sp.]
MKITNDLQKMFDDKTFSEDEQRFFENCVSNEYDIRRQAVDENSTITEVIMKRHAVLFDRPVLNTTQGAIFSSLNFLLEIKNWPEAVVTNADESPKRHNWNPVTNAWELV